MYDIITIGAATKDVFLESGSFKFIKSPEFAGGTGECLSFGSKNEVRNIFFSTGGGATNAAVTFSRLGLSVAALTRVGRDSFGDDIIAALKNDNVSVKLIQRDPALKTAYSTLLMQGPGERTVLVYRGSSAKINARELRQVRTKWIYVTSLGGQIDLLRKIWSWARKNKVKIAWNPGGEELKSGLEKLLPFIKQCEVFNVNREEAARVTGCGWRDRECLFANLCGKATYVLITDGERGAYCCGAGERFFASSLGTKPKNTTGAGDAFGSAFVAGLILRNSVDFALRLAILNADSVIRQMGAKTGILKKLPSKAVLSKIEIKKL
ncbi:carbohydrate kinase family protein [Candidatus Uhrbacteria bacterium]|nr:carbohydrate kinase family protein [Candidatus Uhrbacteria bacterium]